MKIRKSLKLVTMFGALLTLAVFLTACGPPNFCGGRFSEHVLAKLDDRIEDLDLTDSQKVKYQEIRTQIKENMEKSMEDRKVFFTRLQDEINSEDPQAEEVAGFLKERLNKFAEVMSANLDLIATLYNTLDAEQKEKVLGKVRKKMNRVAGWCHQD